MIEENALETHALRLQNENTQLKQELERVRAQMLKAYKDRAEIHARLRQIVRNQETGIRNPSPRPSSSS